MTSDLTIHLENDDGKKFDFIGETITKTLMLNRTKVSVNV